MAERGHATCRPPLACCLPRRGRTRPRTSLALATGGAAARQPARPPIGPHRAGRAARTRGAYGRRGLGAVRTGDPSVGRHPRRTRPHSHRAGSGWSAAAARRLRRVDDGAGPGLRLRLGTRLPGRTATSPRQRRSPATGVLRTHPPAGRPRRTDRRRGGEGGRVKREDGYLTSASRAGTGSRPRNSARAVRVLAGRTADDQDGSPPGHLPTLIIPRGITLRHQIKTRRWRSAIKMAISHRTIRRAINSAFPIIARLEYC